MSRSIARLLAVVGAAGILLSCDSSPTEPDHRLPIVLVVVGGDNQSGLINTELPLALKVKVVDSKGKAVPGQLVNFRVTVGGGRMYAGASLTDAAGSAQDYWTLGPTLGLQTVEVVAVDPTSGAKQQFGVFTATGLDPSNLTISPLSQDFGTVVLGSTSSPRTFTLNNSGSGSTGPIAVTLGGANPAEFPIGTDQCNGVSLAPGASCTITVSFTPAAASVRSATLSADATPGQPVSSSLTGTGVTPASLSIAPASNNFDTATVGSTGFSRTFTLTNTGGGVSGPVSISKGGAQPGDFQVLTNPCQGATLAPGASCTISLVFAPSGAGPRSATLTATAAPGGSASATMSGLGLQGAALAITPASRDFGSSVVGIPGSGARFTVSNIGGTATGPIGVTITGVNSGDFQLTSNACQGVSLAVGAACDVNVLFTPTAASTRTATLSATAQPGGIASALLTGTGLPPVIFINPVSKDFGSVSLGVSSASQTFLVTNQQGVSPAVSVALAGTNPADFIIQGDTCTGATVWTSCTVTVRFAPTATGTRTASLRVSALPVGQAIASLTGTGLAPVMFITPVSKDFGSVSLGDNSASQTFVVANQQGSSPAVAVALTGANPADFIIEGNTCSGATFWTSCTVTVRFTPTALGTRTASLQVSALPVGQVVASLTGNGVTPPPAALQISPATVDFGNVPLGGLATMTVNVTNTGGQTSGPLNLIIGGTDAAQFRIGTNHCGGATLTPQGNCVVEVLFSPASPGDKSAFIEVTASPGGDVRAALIGTGI